MIYRAYIRKSVEDENDPSASPARQRAAIQRWATAHGQPTLEWYQDLDISGRHEANRPDWQRLLADLDQPGTAGVVVESIDRSHRNVKEFLDFYDTQLEPRGLTLISATQNIDLATTDGRTMATVVMAFAEAESRKASDRMRGTVQYIKSTGRHWGPHPFGCDRDPETKILIPTQTTYLLNPSTGAAKTTNGLPPSGWEIRRYHDALRAIFELYATGRHGYRDVTWLANQAGWRYWQRDYATPKELTFGIVHSVLHRWPVFAGMIPHVEPSGRVDHSIPPQPANHAPILNVDLCQRVGRVLQIRSQYRNPGNSRRPARVYPLSGILYCHACGGALCGQKFKQKNGDDYVYYRHLQVKPPDCPETMTPAEPLEQDVRNLIMGLAGQTDMLEKVRSALRQALAEAAQGNGTPELAQLHQKTAELERLIDLHVSGLITKDQFISHQTALNAEVAQLQNKTASTRVLADLDQHLDYLLSHLYQFPQAGPYRQKEIIHTIIERIEVQDNAIVNLIPHPWAAPLLDACELCNKGHYIIQFTNSHPLLSEIVGAIVSPDHRTGCG